MTTRTAIFLLSHIYNQDILDLHEGLLDNCDKDFKVFFLADNSRGIFDHCNGDGKFNLFTLSELQELPYPGKGRLAYKFVPEQRQPYDRQRNFRMGNAELPVLLYFRKFPDFDYYWVIEYDVRFSGNWSKLFRHFNYSDADLLATSLVNHGQVPNWARWRSMHLSGIAQNDNWLVKGFFPIYRVSRRALALLDDAYQAGATGHYECLMPSVLQKGGLILEDIGGDGEFTRPENINRFYQNKPTHDSLAPGTFAFRPIMDKPGARPDTLWHPVKIDTETVNGI